MCLDFPISEETSRALFDSYDQYLSILDDQDKRKKLESAKWDERFRDSSLWAEVRSVSHRFHDGLVSLFLKEHEDLTNLAMTYGVF